jgi:hypothetical protein
MDRTPEEKLMKTRRSNTRNTPSRRGISIIEVLIVFTCLSIGMGLCAVTIQLLMRLDADGQARYRSQVVLERLARQLRGDAHSAANAEVEAAKNGKPAMLKLSLGAKHVVTYEPGKLGVARIESRDGNVVEREQYLLPVIRVIGFEMRADAGRQFVALVVSRFNKHSGSGVNRQLETVALVGKDRVLALSARGGPPR